MYHEVVRTQNLECPPIFCSHPDGSAYDINKPEIQGLGVVDAPNYKPEVYGTAKPSGYTYSFSEQLEIEFSHMIAGTGGSIDNMSAEGAE